MIKLEDLPLDDLARHFELNPPALPWNSLVGLPSRGRVPFALLEELEYTGVSGFATDIGGKLDPKVYAHLLIVLSVRTDNGAEQFVQLQFNTDTSPSGTNYSWNWDSRAGGNNASATSNIICGLGAISTAPWPSASMMLIPDFLGTSRAKTTLGISAAILGTHPFLSLAGSWNQSAAITQLNYSLPPGVNFNYVHLSCYALGAL